MKSRAIGRSLGTFLFMAGILLGMALAAAASFAGVEAQFYGFESIYGAKLKTVHCPVLMTTAHPTQVRATVSNPGDQPVNMLVTTDLSSPGLIQTTEEVVALAAHEKKPLEWTVTSQNVDLGFLILAQVSTSPNYAQPARQGTCGIVVLNVPGLTGNELFTLALVASLLFIVAGAVLMELNSPPMAGRKLSPTIAMRFLGIMTLAGMFTSFIGGWLPGIVFLVVAVLGLVVILAFALSD